MQRKKTSQDVIDLENREILDQKSTTRYVSSKRGYRGRREHSVNVVLLRPKIKDAVRMWYGRVGRGKNVVRT